MKICLIAEGSYPYVTGGVSSWIHMLTTALTEHEFIIYAIGAEIKNKGNFKYAFPPNVTEIHEVFMDTFLNDNANWENKIKLSDDEKNTVRNFLNGKEFSWDKLFDLLLGVESASDFILSKDFYDILTESYADEYSQTPFVDYFWTVRSMVLPLFNLIKQPLPDADLYHSVSTGYGGVIGGLCSYIKKKPFMLTEHGIYTREREEEIIKSQWMNGVFKDIWIEFFNSLSKCAYEKADKVITLFNRNKEIEIELGCPGEKILIVPNGVKIMESGVKQYISQDTSEINIGAIVRIVPIKDIKTMLHAFAIVKDEVKNAKFYIMGPSDEDEEYYEECLQLVEILGVEDVIFTGKVNISEYIERMDMVVLTSISEGQPLAVLEGMLYKKASVTTDVGSCRELIYGNNDAYGDAGIVTPVMDYVKIARAIITLAGDKALREQMGKNAFNRVSDIYTFDKFISSYRNLYNEVGEK